MTHFFPGYVLFMSPEKNQKAQKESERVFPGGMKGKHEEEMG